MSYYNYTDINSFLHDEELIKLLCFDREFDELIDIFIQDDFLKIDQNMSIPFFAEIRDYRGAIESDNPDFKWLVKPIKGNDMIGTEMAMIVYFLDFFTRSLSVPVIVTKIDGVLYRATKMILRAEQLSGANYTVYPELIEQLLLDMVNRWIFCDEDRNPNNYLIKYNSKNSNLILAIDFGASDLLSDGMKIKGLSKQFGWQRKEKTRYLTPLKAEHFMNYSMDFYNMRFELFNQLTTQIIAEVCHKVFRFNPEKEKYSQLITRNIQRRINYVYKYFSSQLSGKIEAKRDHSVMGKSFQGI